MLLVGQPLRAHRQPFIAELRGDERLRFCHRHRHALRGGADQPIDGEGGGEERVGSVDVRHRQLCLTEERVPRLAVVADLAGCDGYDEVVSSDLLGCGRLLWAGQREDHPVARACFRLRACLLARGPAVQDTCLLAFPLQLVDLLSLPVQRLRLGRLKRHLARPLRVDRGLGAEDLL